MNASGCSDVSRCSLESSKAFASRKTVGIMWIYSHLKCQWLLSCMCSTLIKKTVGTMLASEVVMALLLGTTMTNVLYNYCLCHKLYA